MDESQAHSAMPSGTVTFLFTDIEGSTKLLERIREDFRAVISEHNALFRAAFARWNGREIQFLGDGFHAAFRRATDAVACVAELQRELANHTWPAGATVRVRMGLNTGEAEIDADHYVGIGVHRAARVAAAGHGGQVLLSQTTRDLVYMDLPPGVSLRHLGDHMLKDIRYPQPIYQLDIEGLPIDFPPLRTLGAEEPPAPGEPPYKGLQFFGEADAEWFFGRDETTARLVDDLRGQRFLAVVGASGSGKSSIIRAGLVPALRRATDARWEIVVITPTVHPLEALAVGLTRGSESVTAAATLMDDLARDARSLHLYVQKTLTPHPSPMNRLGEGGLRTAPLSRSSHGRGVGGEGKVLLVVDQFEELFTLCRKEDERRAFVDNLLYAAGADGGTTTVVLALRADFYDHLAPYPALREAVAKHQEYIGPMSADELRLAIEEPARRGGWEFVPGLVDLMLQDVGAGKGQQPEPGALPLLSHALLETWRRRRGNTMSLRGYNEAGGVRGAIARTAETVYRQLSPQEQPVARSVFLRLTELGEGTQDTRRRAAVSELIPPPPLGDPAQVEDVLVKLADARLITTGEGTVEVAHEALIREWPTLRGWLTQDREGLRLHRHLTQSAQEWESLGRDAGALYRGSRLAQVAEWAGANSRELNALEQAFLAGSQELARREETDREAQRQRELVAAQQLAAAERQRAEEQARAAGRLRQRAVYLAVALVAAAGLLFAALWLWRMANQNARASEEQARLATSRELATAAVNNLAVDPERSALLALQALNKAETLEAANALHQALPELRLLRTIPLAADVERVAFSPDGSLLATAHSDKQTYVWNSTTGQRLFGIGSTDPVRDVAFRPDGQVLALGGLTQVRVFDVANRRHLFELGASMAPEMQQYWASDSGVGRVAFHPDGTRLAIANLDGLPRVWNLPTRSAVLTLTGHAREATAIAYSRDGTRLATGSSDQTVRIWDGATGKELRKMDGSASASSRIVFSPNGTRLASLGSDGTLTVWDVASGQRVSSLAGQAIGFQDVAYTPDGKQLVTAGSDGTVRMWDTASGLQVRVGTGHKSLVREVSVSPDGQLLATCSDDGTAKVWDNGPGRELLAWSAHTGWATEVSYSPDGSVLATVGEDNAVRFWDPSTGRLVRSLSAGGPGGLYSLCFSPDGQRLAAGSGEGIASVWDLGTGGQMLTLNVGNNWVTDLAFSPDGTRLATSGRDGSVAVWDAATGQRLVYGKLELGTEMWSVAFSPDGVRLAGGSTDGYVRIWDWAISAALREGAEGVDVYSVAWSSDGQRLASGRQDGVITLWDPAEGKRLQTLPGHTGMVVGLAFSPNSARLASAAMDGLAKVWDVATGAEVATLYGNTTSVYSVAFHPDGTHLATAALDGTVRTYTLDLDELVALAQARLTRKLTDEECRKFLHLNQCP